MRSIKTIRRARRRDLFIDEIHTIVGTGAASGGVMDASNLIKEEHHDVKYTLPALHSAAELLAKYIGEWFLPDKAIDVIDELGAFQHTNKKTKKKKLISVSDVENMIARIACIPTKTVSSSDKNAMASLGEDFKNVGSWTRQGY